MSRREPGTLAVLAVLALVGVLVVAAASAPVNAQQSDSVTIDGVSIPASVAQGSSFDITVDVSATDGSGVSSIDIALTLPDGLTCTPSGAQTAQLSNNEGDATFDCTADAAGDYRGEIQVDADATGEDLSDSTQTGLRVLSPGALTVSTSLSDSTIDTDGESTLTVVIHNTGSVALDYTVSKTIPSGLSSSLDSGSESDRVGGGSIVTLEYTLSSSTTNTYLPSVTVDGENGQSLTESESLTVESTGGGDDGGGGGGGGSSGPSSTASVSGDRVQLSLDNARAGEPVSVDVPNSPAMDRTGVQMRSVEVTLTRSGDSSLDIDTADTPSQSTPEGTRALFAYDVSTDLTDDDIDRATVRLTVQRDRVEDRESVTALRRTDDGWESVDTTVVESGDEEFTYAVETTEFSEFALVEQTGDESTADAATTTATATATTTPTPTATATATPTATATTDPPVTTTSQPGFGVIVAVVALLISAVLARRRH